MTDEELKQYLENHEGYFNVRILPDGLVGCLKMIYTCGVVFDLEKEGHSGRVCYETVEKAIRACNLLTSINDEPMPGYTADKRSWKLKTQ